MFSLTTISRNSVLFVFSAKRTGPYSLGEGAQKLEGVKVLAGSHVNVRPRGVVDLGRKTGYELFVELGIEANVDSLLI